MLQNNEIEQTNLDMEEVLDDDDSGYSGNSNGKHVNQDLMFTQSMQNDGDESQEDEHEVILTSTQVRLQ